MGVYRRAVVKSHLHRYAAINEAIPILLEEGGIEHVMRCLGRLIVEGILPVDEAKRLHVRAAKLAAMKPR